LTFSKPLLEKTETTPDRIAIPAEFPRMSRESLFDFWINPDQLKKWWPPVAELEPRVGGNYHFSWPSQNWHLRGKITLFKRGEKLGFTWKWDHESVKETRVTLSFVSLPKIGTKLTLQHEGYAKTKEDRKIRDEHIEGWMFFLGKLQEIT
jgi:uncharacterized protein YndB with AHSA1/START domain